MIRKRELIDALTDYIQVRDATRLTEGSIRSYVLYGAGNMQESIQKLGEVGDDEFVFDFEVTEHVTKGGDA